MRCFLFYVIFRIKLTTPRFECRLDGPVFFDVNQHELRCLQGGSPNGLFIDDVYHNGYFYDFSNNKDLINKGIDVVIVETRSEKVPMLFRGPQVRPPAERVIVLGQTTGEDFENISKNIRHKLFILYDFLMLSAEESRVIIFADSDVSWTGCNKNLTSVYMDKQKIYNNENLVIFGTEVSDFGSPIPHHVYPHHEALNVAHLNWYNRSGAFYKFLNSGFYVGTYSAVRSLLSAVIGCFMSLKNVDTNFKMKFGNHFPISDVCSVDYRGGDQGLFHLMFLYPQSERLSVVLDYSLEFSVNTYGIDIPNFLIVDHSPFTVVNSLTNHEVCFIHFNGDPKDFTQMYFDYANELTSFREFGKQYYDLLDWLLWDGTIFERDQFWF
jgi:hypothetical protein